MAECPVTKAWKMLGKPWRIVIIARLLDGCKSYNELLWSMKGISSKTLSNALKELCKEELIKVETNRNRRIYSLTEKGKDLAKIVENVRIWSEKWLM
ncbi:MAG TPA: helix-turn-helix domain-containing protein [Geobacterales bacterium]|nr:helix-turn-helix domain-containing protein [Geobacterales bacterium]